MLSLFDRTIRRLLCTHNTVQLIKFDSANPREPVRLTTPDQYYECMDCGKEFHTTIYSGDQLPTPKVTAPKNAKNTQFALDTPQDVA